MNRHKGSGGGGERRLIREEAGGKGHMKQMLPIRDVRRINSFWRRGEGTIRLLIREDRNDGKGKSQFKYQGGDLEGKD